MKDNFNLGKFLTENKLTFYGRVSSSKLDILNESEAGEKLTSRSKLSFSDLKNGDLLINIKRRDKYYRVEKIEKDSVTVKWMNSPVINNNVEVVTNLQNWEKKSVNEEKYFGKIPDDLRVGEKLYSDGEVYYVEEIGVYIPEELIKVRKGDPIPDPAEIGPQIKLQQSRSWGVGDYFPHDWGSDYYLDDFWDTFTKWEDHIADDDEDEDDIAFMPENATEGKKLSPAQAHKLHEFLSSKLGEAFTSEFPLKSNFYFELEKAGLGSLGGE